MESESDMDAFTRLLDKFDVHYDKTPNNEIVLDCHDYVFDESGEIVRVEYNYNDREYVDDF